MAKYYCSKCNGPVDQPCCMVETAKLKPGVVPNGCVLVRGESVEWKLISKLTNSEKK